MSLLCKKTFVSFCSKSFISVKVRNNLSTTQIVAAIATFLSAIKSYPRFWEVSCYLPISTKNYSARKLYARNY